MRFRLQALGGALALALAGCPAWCPAWAHHQGVAHEPPAEGIAIPSLSHGQMAVIAANRAAILNLAARQMPTDRVMRRLQGFISIQFSACAWGLVPGSLEEDSPFNECTHAHLAGTQALLLHLQGMPGDRTAVHALVERIELDMLANDAALVLCRYSDEPFNTAEVVYPRWGDATASTAGVVTAACFMLAGCGAWWRVRWRRRCNAPAPPISA